MELSPAVLEFDDGGFLSTHSAEFIGIRLEFQFFAPVLLTVVFSLWSLCSG